MSNEEKQAEEMVREMASLTLLSNKLNPIQEKNLKMYPMIYFNGIEGISIKYDLSNGRETEVEPSEHPGEKFVEYHLWIEEGSNPKLDVRFMHLERSVRNLFWSDVQVYVFFNEKQVFASEKKK